MNIRIGRYISLPDIEAQLAPDNYTYSHSLLYTVDPYTQTGILATVKLNNHWLIQLGLSGGNDVALWTTDAKPTLTACVSYSWINGNDNIYPCANGINDGKYAYNNIQMFVNTWYHIFNKSTHMATEAYYMYEKAVPNVAGNVSNLLPTETGANEAFLRSRPIDLLRSRMGAVNYIEHQFSCKDYISIRNEFLDDHRGQRTGYMTHYSENLIGYGHWIGTTVLQRPELRFEHAYDLPAYDNGHKKNQLVFAADVIFHF
jgi:hypothetical protein